MQRGGAARCPVLLRPATTVDPRRFSMYNNDLINLATDPEGPGHNTTLADVQDVRHLETSRQDDGTVPLSNLGRFLDMATIQAFGQQPTDDGIVFLGSSDSAALVTRVQFVRVQLAFNGTVANDAVASILCTNPSVCTAHGAIVLMTIDEPSKQWLQAGALLQELVLWSSGRDVQHQQWRDIILQCTALVSPTIIDSSVDRALTIQRVLFLQEQQQSTNLAAAYARPHQSATQTYNSFGTGPHEAQCFGPASGTHTVVGAANLYSSMDSRPLGSASPLGSCAGACYTPLAMGSTARNIQQQLQHVQQSQQAPILQTSSNFPPAAYAQGPPTFQSSAAPHMTQCHGAASAAASCSSACQSGTTVPGSLHTGRIIAERPLTPSVLQNNEDIARAIARQFPSPPPVTPLSFERPEPVLLQADDRKEVVVLARPQLDGRHFSHHHLLGDWQSLDLEVHSGVIHCGVADLILYNRGARFLTLQMPYDLHLLADIALQACETFISQQPGSLRPGLSQVSEELRDVGLDALPTLANLVHLYLVTGCSGEALQRVAMANIAELQNGASLLEALQTQGVSLQAALLQQEGVLRRRVSLWGSARSTPRSASQAPVSTSSSRPGLSAGTSRSVAGGGDSSDEEPAGRVPYAENPEFLVEDDCGSRSRSRSRSPEGVRFSAAAPTHSARSRSPSPAGSTGGAFAASSMHSARSRLPPSAGSTGRAPPGSAGSPPHATRSPVGGGASTSGTGSPSHGVPVAAGLATPPPTLPPSIGVGGFAALVEARRAVLAGERVPAWYTPSPSMGVVRAGFFRPAADVIAEALVTERGPGSQAAPYDASKLLACLTAFTTQRHKLCEMNLSNFVWWRLLGVASAGAARSTLSSFQEAARKLPELRRRSKDIDKVSNTVDGHAGITTLQELAESELLPLDDSLVEARFFSIVWKDGDFYSFYLNLANAEGERSAGTVYTWACSVLQRLHEERGSEDSQTASMLRMLINAYVVTSQAHLSTNDMLALLRRDMHARTALRPPVEREPRRGRDRERLPLDGAGSHAAEIDVNAAEFASLGLGDAKGGLSQGGKMQWPAKPYQVAKILAADVIPDLGSGFAYTPALKLALKCPGCMLSPKHANKSTEYSQKDYRKQFECSPYGADSTRPLQAHECILHTLHRCDEFGLRIARFVHQQRQQGRTDCDWMLLAMDAAEYTALFGR